MPLPEVRRGAVPACRATREALNFQAQIWTAWLNGQAQSCAYLDDPSHIAFCMLLVRGKAGFDVMSGGRLLLSAGVHFQRRISTVSLRKGGRVFELLR